MSKMRAGRVEGKPLVAKNVTYDAVDAAKDVVVQVYNDILALFQK